MNPKLETIFARRSVRQYRPGAVDDATVRDLLEAAMAAPSAVAEDARHLIVGRDPGMLGRITEGLPNGKMLADAAVGFVVCGDLHRTHGQLEGYLVEDCSAAVENLLLAATALGLGACWLGVHPRPERAEFLRTLFGLPANIVPVAVVSIGWPLAPPEPRTRYREDAVHKERW
jgi:nitroreductase